MISQIYQGTAIESVLNQIQNELGADAHLHSIQMDSAAISITVTAALKQAKTPAQTTQQIMSGLLNQKVQKTLADGLAHHSHLSTAVEHILQSQTHPLSNVGCVVLLGANRAGKTSVMARLAWLSRKEFSQRPICMVVPDEASKQKLAQLAKLLPADLQTTNSPVEANRQDENACVFIDHPTKNPQFKNIQHWLVLNANQPKLMPAITRQFLKFHRLCGVFFTHLDQTQHYGFILNHAQQFKLPVMGWSFGVRLSQTEVANSKSLLRMLGIH